MTEIALSKRVKHVEPVARLVEDEAGRPAAAHRDVARRRRHERVVLERRGVEDADLASSRTPRRRASRRRW